MVTTVGLEENADCDFRAAACQRQGEAAHTASVYAKYQFRSMVNASVFELTYRPSDTCSIRRRRAREHGRLHFSVSPSLSFDSFPFP
jgi:hypothetical protein